MKNLLTLYLVVIVSGCALTQYNPLQLSRKSQYKLEQVTLLSPNEPGWTLLKHELHSATFTKRYNLSNKTAVMAAMIYKVGVFKTSRQFLKHIAEQREKNGDKKRFKTLSVKNKYVTFKELPCLHYETLVEDHREEGIDSKNFSFLKTSGYICRYPLEYAALQIEVSHRSNEKEMPKTLLKVGEEFFNDIQLVKGTIKRLKTIP